MRQAREGDFFLDVPDIGKFRFGRRTKRDQYKIRGIYAQMTENNFSPSGDVVDAEAWWHASLLVMTVLNPEGFSPDDIDPLTEPEEGDQRIHKVFLALREKELSFRPKPADGSADKGEGVT